MEYRSRTLFAIVFSIGMVTIVLGIRLFTRGEKHYKMYVADVRSKALALTDRVSQVQGVLLYGSLRDIGASCGPSVQGSDLDSLIEVAARERAQLLDRLWPVELDTIDPVASMGQGPAHGLEDGAQLDHGATEKEHPVIPLAAKEEKAPSVVSHVSVSDMRSRDHLDIAALLRGIIDPAMVYSIVEDTLDMRMSLRLHGERPHAVEHDGDHGPAQDDTKAALERTLDVHSLCQSAAKDYRNCGPLDRDTAVTKIERMLEQQFGPRYIWMQERMPFKTLYGSGLELRIHGYLETRPSGNRLVQDIHILRLVPILPSR